MFKFEHQGTGEMFYATRESAGFDICASHDAIIPPGEWAIIGTGLKILESLGLQSVELGGLPVNVLPELQLRPRSGLAAKQGITILNAPSTVDADYRGEIRVNLINHSKIPFKIQAGERIAQGVCALVFHAPSIAVRDIERGEGGFGSTGLKHV